MTKFVECSFDLEPQKKSNFIVKCGDFEYEMITDFPKWPDPDWIFTEVAAGWVDHEDNVYVLMRDRQNRVIKLDDDGNYLGEYKTGMVGPHFGYVTPQNTLLMADVMGHCFYETTLDGKILRNIGPKGKPSDTGNEFLWWYRARRYGYSIPTEPSVLVNNEKWNFKERCAHIARTGGPFNMPTCAVMGNHGEYYFGDGYGNCAVHKFDKDGNYVATWGEAACTPDGGVTRGPGKFFGVHGIAVDKLDRVWATDRDNNAVNVFDSEGNVVAYLTGNLGQPSDFWFDGTYMFVAGRAGYITIFDMDLAIVGQLGYFNSQLMTHAIYGNSKGDLYVFPCRCDLDHQMVKLKRLR